MRPGLPDYPNRCNRRACRSDEFEPRLTAAQQFEIHGSKKLAIDFRPMLLTARQIDAESAAQRVEARRGPGKALARECQSIDILAGNRLSLGPDQLGVEKAEVKFGIVGDERSATHKCEKFVHHFRE